RAWTHEARAPARGGPWAPGVPGAGGARRRGWTRRRRRLPELRVRASVRVDVLLDRRERLVQRPSHHAVHELAPFGALVLGAAERLVEPEQAASAVFLGDRERGGGRVGVSEPERDR